MVMDSRPGEMSSSVRFKGFTLDDASLSVLSDQNLNALKLEQSLPDHGLMDGPLPPRDLTPCNFPPLLTLNPEGDSPEDCDFSDIVLKYINQMLMEEDMEEKTCMFQESSALQAAEKSFYEILGEKYPPSPDRPPPYLNHNIENPDDDFSENYSTSAHPPYLNHECRNPEINFKGNYSTYGSSISTDFSHPHLNHINNNPYDNFNGNFSTYSCSISNNNSKLVDTSLIFDPGDCKSSLRQSIPVDFTSQPASQSSFSSSNSISNTFDGFMDSPVSTLRVPDSFVESQSSWHFKKGVEEASKFLPNGNNLIADLGCYGLVTSEPKEEATEVAIKAEKKDETEYSSNGSRGRKNPHPKDMDFEEGRSNKQSAVYPDATVRSEMFDTVLLCCDSKAQSALTTLRESLQNGVRKSVPHSGQSKGSSGGKTRGKKQGSKRETVDLRTLLIHCAQAIATDDRRSSNELLKQIRQHSSPIGDGTQRLAHWFAEGLEARLEGTGTQIYTALVTKRTSAADILKAYHLFLAACPFKKLSNFFSTQTIMNLAENATRLHIIDFGILYGFQWPVLIQRLSKRHGGPPKLRITGIELPQAGFRPAERVEETGRRLANYAESFNVPFEFNAIAQKWETIQIEDLKINTEEVLVVNCLYRSGNLLDETVVVDSPRNAVLNLIRKTNPDVFIHGIVNGAYSVPYFVTRFREALFHFSALFDMLETNIPREHQERILIEKEMLGREAINVIACEGTERVERPETYKQWRVRILRAGFRQLPLNQEIMGKARHRVKSNYHKDFVIDEDSRWMLQGWKGRIIYAMSTWKPAYDC